MRINAHNRLRNVVTASSSDKDIAEKLTEINEGREGKNVIDINGKEVPKSLWLGRGSYIEKHPDGSIAFFRFKRLSGKYMSFYISNRELKLIKRYL